MNSAKSWFKVLFSKIFCYIWTLFVYYLALCYTLYSSLICVIGAHLVLENISGDERRWGKGFFYLLSIGIWTEYKNYFWAKRTSNVVASNFVRNRFFTSPHSASSQLLFTLSTNDRILCVRALSLTDKRNGSVPAERVEIKLINYTTIRYRDRVIVQTKSALDASGPTVNIIRESPERFGGKA